MMMRMLEAGGMRILKDEIRKADEDNPAGYYEFEKVKELKKDPSWLENAIGKAVKIISSLLEHLPERYTYKIIFMYRNMEEILNSQRQMLIRRGEPTDEVSDEKMGKMFLKHLQKIEERLNKQSKRHKQKLVNLQFLPVKPLSVLVLLIKLALQTPMELL